jgi:3D (Asp-Asp-Asp) domain-containing protein
MKKAVYILMVLSAINTTYMLVVQQENDERLNQLEDLIKSQNSVKVTATMYNAVVNQCDEDPLVTAGMYKINPNKASEHKWIAVSRDLLKRWGGVFNYGDKVYISGAGHKSGVYTIVDTMNKRFKNRIDFLETQGTKHYKYEDVLLAKL